MADHPGARGAVRFGPFEWDPARAELRRRGVRLKLTGQPLEVLTMLLAHGDRIVTREELRDKLWGKDTFVDFEQGLNTAIARLRQTLGDSAENPRFIETIPGRGYRFIADVSPTPPAPAQPDAPAAADGDPNQAPTSRIDRRTWLAGSLGLAVGAVGTYLGIRPGLRSEGVRVARRFVVSAPPAPALLLSTGIGQDLAISSDGRRIAYRAAVDGAAGLYMRALDRPDRIGGRFLPGTDLFSPFFSPDGIEVGFYAFGSRSLMRASVLGGSASRVLGSLDMLRGASWSADEGIVFATGNPSLGIMRVAPGEGRPAALTRPGPEENHVQPEWLPSGRGLLFSSLPADGRSAPPQIHALDALSGETRALITGSQPRYVDSGHLVYLLGNDLLAVRFDEERLRIESEPATVLAGIAATGGFGQYSVSRDGTLLVTMDTGSTSRELVWVDRDGREEELPAAARAYTYPRISPRGRRIALNTREAGRARIFIWDDARATETLLLPVSDASLDLYPVWTTDGERLVYTSGMRGRVQFRMAAVGSSGPGEPVAGGTQLRAPYFLSASGTELVYAQQDVDGPALRKTSLALDAEPVDLLSGARNADLSPDGRFIVYQGNETDRFEIYVRSFPALEDYYQKVSTAGGIQPVWSPRNDELFYIEPGPPPRLMSVGVRTGSRPVMSPPRPLIEWPYFHAELGRTYDVSRPGGERFLAIRNAASGAGAPQEPRVEIVLDWSGELEERVPSGPA